MKSLDNFSSFEITNIEEVKGGTFGLLSLFGSCAPKPVCQPAPVVCQPAPCYTPPAPSCNTGGYSAPKPTCNTGIKISFSFSLGGCK
jgi:hypothetical protein